MSPRCGSTPRLTNWPSVAVWLWLWSLIIFDTVKLRHRLLHSPAPTEIPVYIRINVGLYFVSGVWNVYIFYLIPGRKKKNVTSGGLGCGRWTPNYIKIPAPPLTKRRNNEEENSKVLTLKRSMAMGPSGARCQEWQCRLIAGSKFMLLLRHSTEVSDEESWVKWIDSFCIEIRC
jgi:hypothetical protein